MANDDHNSCQHKCFMCERPWDTFKHVHLTPDTKGPPAEGTAVEGRNMVLCFPCLSGLSQACEPLLRAYANGGYIFDTYAQKHMKRGRLMGGPSGGGTPLPKYMEQILDDLARQMGGEGGEADGHGH